MSEKARAKTAMERRRIESELKDLRSPTRRGIKIFLKRTGQGLSFIGSKAAAQAKALAEAEKKRQEQAVTRVRKTRRERPKNRNHWVYGRGGY